MNSNCCWRSALYSSDPRLLSSVAPFCVSYLHVLSMFVQTWPEPYTLPPDINAVFIFSWDASIKKSIWLNILVFGGNADSILNDLGMFLVCGAVKHFALSHIFNRILKSSSMIFGSYKNKSSQSIESVGSNFRKTPIMRERRIASGQGQGSVSLSLEPSSSEGGQEQCVHPECPSTQISATRWNMCSTVYRHGRSIRRQNCIL